MKSHEVIRAAVEEPGVKAVAAALGVSPALVYKWCEPAGPTGDGGELSGARNPLDRVRELYAVTKDHRLVRWLCNEAGGFFVANPTVDPTRSPERTLFAESRAVVRDFSRLLDTVTESTEDDHSVDPDEAREIRQKWEDLKAQLERFVVGCERGHYHFTKKG